MTGIALADLPSAPRAAWSDLRDRLWALLGDDLVAMWAHGGTVSVTGTAHGGDLDTYVLVARRPDPSTVERIEEAETVLAERHGVEWDSWYVLAEDARGSDQPSHAWREDRRDTSWAIHRAHWLAGRYATVHGLGPTDVVGPPAWRELLVELDRELEHIERHVHEGDTDPYEATYAHLTGCRILHALETGSVVISKRAAGAWGLEHLPDRWHQAVRAAVRTYDGGGSDGDAELIAASMAPFVAFVRERLPPMSDRPPGWIPRWSGW